MVYIPDFVWSYHALFVFETFMALPYRCNHEGCYFIIDTGCVGTTIPFTHPSHKHENIHCLLTDKKTNLWGRVENKEAFRCVECNFYLDTTCATLPLKSRKQICFFAGHLNCVIGDYPFMKSAKLDGRSLATSTKFGKKR